MVRNKRSYRFQAVAFKDYARKFENIRIDRLISLFEIWAASKNFSDEDKRMIWNLIRKYH